MNCSDWEERIALYAGGDLNPAQADEVEEHLGSCDDCRTFASGITDGLELLRAAHEELIAAGHYTAVRAAVLSRLAERRPSWRRWMWAPVLAAGIAMAGVLLSIRPTEKPRPHTAEVWPAEAPASSRPAERTEPAAPLRHLSRVRPHRIVASIRRVEGPPPLAEPMVVKLVTEDPDIVIYWIADRKEEDK